jgi:hypothetical protein
LAPGLGRADQPGQLRYGARGLTEGSASFWKKKQKLLLIKVRVECNAYPKDQKFFGSFFQKRTACLHRPTSIGALIVTDPDLHSTLQISQC